MSTAGECEREKQGGKEGKEKGGKRQRQKEREEKQEKDKDQHNSFSLISSMYNIKAITGCLCQHVWNNTLVSGGEMR